MKELTLKDVLGWKETDISHRQRRELEGTAGVRAIRQAVEEKGIPGLWETTRDELSRSVEALLNVSLLDVLRRAWNKTKELARYRDREKYPPDKTYIVPLAEHTIRSRHTPHLEIRINEQPAGRIDFEIRLEVALKGLHLHIQDGRIRKIDTGECRGKGKLLCEGFLLAQREWKKLEIPGSIDLGEGIEI